MTDDFGEDTSKPEAKPFVPSFVEETTAEVPATEKLKAARERLLGKDVPLHDGQPEKGIGSKFHALHPAHKAQATEKASDEEAAKEEEAK